MSTIRPGLVSITFRQLAPREIVEAAATAGLTGIEWGGDIHVPHGDLVRAAEVRRMTADAGLVVPAYGSYYRAGVSEHEGLAFARVLDTAHELGARVIRIWAGKEGSVQSDPVARAGVTGDCLRIADMAAKAGIAVASEYHGGTLTDTDPSTVTLLTDVRHPSFMTYWQPRVGLTADEACEGLRGILPRLAHLHVFHWWPGHTRQPMAEGTDRWLRYLELAATAPGDRFAMLEFVPNDDPAVLAGEAATLRRLLARVGDTQNTPK